MKHSRISIVFQLVIILLIIFILYQLLNILFLIFSIILLVISFLFFNKKEKIEYLAYLDDDVWSLKIKNNKEIYRVGIKNILNHQLYVVVQFKQSEQKPIVIWFDQLNRTQWKNLKVLSVLK
ncbi:hypothetical protein [Acinetobacter faecalis]|uniref:hypothetical protein n=1 Tax=Acinetobacter faecalis TaxID=2665161 RepID=UPI002A90EC22|nr:hypothetical protein [Acinetobacter faecalis]MDY6458864.1 hypothetical protein [Acinetobacter faecalis]MDY6460877.1 hypothetical protein [Acinetobacter faecalis]